MGYHKANGRYADTIALTLRASSALAASENGAWVEIGDRTQLRLTLDVTAVSGTSPTLDLSIETASDSSGSNATTVGTFAQKTAAASQYLICSGVGRFFRYVATLGGSASPTVTFSLSGEAV
mgnify:FL=1